MEEATQYKTINGKRYKLWGSYNSYTTAKMIERQIYIPYTRDTVVVRTKEGVSVYCRSRPYED